jgi:hypothetical protein
MCSKLEKIIIPRIIAGETSSFEII